ncbi:MAG TPA: hypothetical protein DCP92_05860 [Nitrospiraceae bacterium]|nr:hypothetical protein [Nitrospiraceae bacterium]
MSKPPYAKARRVCWIVDNGSAHRGSRAVERLQSHHKNLVLVHTPVHASWLNQIEIYFSIIQRKVLTPNDFKSLNELAERLLCFQKYYEQIATPFEWKSTRNDLNTSINKVKTVSSLTMSWSMEPSSISPPQEIGLILAADSTALFHHGHPSSEVPTSCNRPFVGTRLIDIPL